MKMGYVASILLIIISALLIFFTSFLSDTTKDMTEILNKTEKFIENNQTKEADACFRVFLKKWKKCEKIYRLQIEEEKTEEINSIISDITSYFKSNSLENYFEASYRLKFHLENLYEKTKVSIETVL